MTALKIAIIGAGPSGLTLATILLNASIPFTVYENDASPHERDQGGTLDLHPDGGQLALREAGLWEEFVKHARPESDVLKLVRQTGEVLWDGNGPDAREVTEETKFDHRPEIDRTLLKQILLGSLPPDCVRWGTKLAKVVSAGEGKSELHFADGSVEKEFDLVVGADGAWSKVRQLLSSEGPYYSGVTGIETSANDVDEKRPWMSGYVGQGNCFSFGEGRSIQIQRLGNGTIRTYGCLRKPESFIQDCGIDWTKPETARKEYVDCYFGDCADDLKRVLLESTDSMIPRALYMLPVGYRWESQAGVTLLGDAAHLMTPFAGIGVNVAMTDSLQLSRRIIKHVENPQAMPLSTAVQEYEADMFVRGERAAQKTWKNLELHFSAKGNDHLLHRLRQGA